MSQERKEARLAELVGVTPEEARAALEATAWSMREAAQLLWQERERARKAEAAQAARSLESGRRPGRALCELFARVRRAVAGGRFVRGM